MKINGFVTDRRRRELQGVPLGAISATDVQSRQRMILARSHRRLGRRRLFVWKEAGMRYILALIIVTMVAATSVFMHAQAPAAPAAPPVPVSHVTFVDHEQVAAALAKGGTLVGASDVIVQGSHRDKPGGVEVHDHEMDVLYVIDGTATFVTGGKMVGGKNTRPGQWLGTDITGGKAQQLAKGDVIVVPAGTPHWFKDVPSTISYFVVKVIKP